MKLETILGGRFFLQLISKKINLAKDFAEGYYGRSI
jgi:hypothetical protein